MHSTGLFLIGTKHTIELKPDPESDGTIAQCRGAQASFQSGKNYCDWSEEYDTLDDASEGARDHADGGVTT